MTYPFSVLLSVYHREKPTHLSECLDSINEQSLKANEIILVEDGPLTKELYDVIDYYVNEIKELKIIKIEKNVGLGKALNKGLQYCSFDIVARMDADDIAKEDRFKTQIDLLIQSPNIDIIGSWVEEFSSSTKQILSIRKLPQYPSELYTFGKRRNPLNHPTVMFRKNAVLNAGGYLHCPLFEDYYLWARMLKRGSKAYNIQKSLLFFRISEETYKRRGGLKYACDEVKFQLKLHDIGYINTSICIENILIRFVIRIIPNKLRQYIYHSKLRNKQ